MGKKRLLKELLSDDLHSYNQETKDLCKAEMHNVTDRGLPQDSESFKNDILNELRSRRPSDNMRRYMVFGAAAVALVALGLYILTHFSKPAEPHIAESLKEKGASPNKKVSYSKLKLSVFSIDKVQHKSSFLVEECNVGSSMFTIETNEELKSSLTINHFDRGEFKPRLTVNYTDSPEFDGFRTVVTSDYAGRTVYNFVALKQ